MLDWLKPDFGKLQEMLSSMEGLGSIQMPDIGDQLKNSGIDLGGLSGIGNPGGTGDINNLFPKENNNELDKTLDVLMDLMNPPTKASNGMKYTIKLKITGNIRDGSLD